MNDKERFIANLQYEVPIDTTSIIEQLLISLLKDDRVGTCHLLTDLLYTTTKNIRINVLRLIGNISPTKFLNNFHKDLERILDEDSDIEVIEYTIRIIEKQMDVHNIALLRCKKFKIKWLDDYRLTVIRDFEDGY